MSQRLTFADLRFATRSRLPVWVFDLDSGRILWANAAALKVWRSTSLEELSSRDLTRDMSETAADRLAGYRARLATGLVLNELWTIYPKGHPCPLVCRFEGIALEDGRIGMLVEGEPVTQNHPEILQAAYALINTSAIVSIFDMKGLCRYMNPAARSVYEADRPLLSDRIVDRDRSRALIAGAPGISLQEHVLTVKTAQGHRIHRANVTYGTDALSGEQTMILTEIDITEQERQRARAKYLIDHDPMTGLLNRTAIRERFDSQTALEPDAAIVFCFLDVDNFKHINDIFGHKMGDMFLIEVANRLSQTLPMGNVIARIGGDEFLIMAARPGDRATVEADLRVSLADLERGISIMGHEHRVEASVGVSRYPEDGPSFDSLLHAADMALYAAKQSPDKSILGYEDVTDRMSQGGLGLRDFKAAMARDAFRLHFQPRVCVQTGKIIGVEALVRLEQEDGSLLLPDVFIPQSEATGFIHELGAWVMREAVAGQAQLAAEGMPLLMSVNVSAIQLRDASLSETLRKLCAEYDADPRRIELEITESACTDRSGATPQTLEDIQKQGFLLTIDDFGKAYSNIMALERHDLHSIKMDRSLTSSSQYKRLAKGVITLAHALGARIVAEGVETREQLDWLTENGCDEIQGHFISEALALPELIVLLRAVAAAEGERVITPTFAEAELRHQAG